jgi:hypothetical protein
MTQARRPDGSGGPLAENERIDDIQFYTSRQAELLIDDVVLYEPAGAEEKQPFPSRFLFTGWFDTGRQGLEWPGSFTIVPHASPRTWKAAQSVLDPVTKSPWLRVHLRGPRPVRGKVLLRFAYRLVGAKEMTLEPASGKESVRLRLEDLSQGKWAEKTIELPVGKMKAIEELRFRLPAGATLEIDDVLLYEPLRAER